jgi:long-chain acyl-CoA synthetase
MPTFYDQFKESARQFPDNVALEIQRQDRVDSVTYAELTRMAESVGRWVSERVQRQSRVAILAANHPRWVAAYLGAIASGCTVVPLDTALHADQIGKLLKNAEATLLFCDAKRLPLAHEASQGLQIQLVLTEKSQAPEAKSLPDCDAMFDAGPGNFQAASAAEDDLAALLYTSGTTADPKGVMLTHGNLLGEVNAVFGLLKIGSTDAVLGILPMFHVLAQMANLMLPLVKGARVVYLETLNTTELLRALQERNITAFAVVPQFFYLIHEKIFKEVNKRGAIASSILGFLIKVNLFLRRFGLNAGRLFFGKIHATFGKKMRYLVTGGSRFEPSIARDFQAFGIDILNAYGLTETCAAAFLNSPGHVVIGSVGPPLPTIEGKIFDPQLSEEGGPPVGEILIRGPIVTKGYWNRPDATAEALKDGWLYTGDLGYFDSRGNLFITGRKKEIIVLANGKNIYPEEIEAHYLKAPSIKEMCVMSMEATPGDPTSERLYAVVVPNFDALKERKVVNAKEVIRWEIEGLSHQIASTKRIGAYEIWQDDLPRTTTRKLKRFEIEKRVRANQGKHKDEDADVPSQKPLTAEDEAWLARTEVQRALSVIRESASKAPEKFRPDDNLELDLGLDSMQRVELLVALEQQLGGDVEESQLAEIYTLRQLVDAVLESAASGKVRSTTRQQFAGWQAVLAEEPEDPEVRQVATPRRVIDTCLYLFSRVMQVFARDRFHLQVSGLEKLPPKGPYIIASNHQGYLDPVILSSVLPEKIFRQLFAVGTSDIFGSGLMRKLARYIRVVVVDPDVNLIPAMRAGAYGLRHGRILILYPEGERSIDGTPKVFKKGAAILSIHLQAPIVPVAIEGFYEAWPRGKKFFQKFARLKITFGDPIIPPPESAASEKAYEQLTAELRARVVEMWEQLQDSRNSTTQAVQPHSAAAD